MAAPYSTDRLVAFQHRDFRLYWLGQLSSTVGVQMQVIGIGWHVYELLREAPFTATFFGHTLDVNVSALGLGGLGLARVLPILLLAVPGGMLADTRNRRRLLLGTQALGGLIAAVLAGLALAGQASVPLLYLATAAAGALLALESPSREAITPNLVPRQHLLNAMSLYTMMNTFGTIAGPLLAGAILARAEIGFVYALAALAYAPALAALLRMADPGRPGAIRPAWGWAGVREGFRFTRRTRVIWGTLWLDFLATLLGSARTLLPIVADQLLGVGAAGYAILATAQPMGAVIAGSLVSLRRRIVHQGLIFLACVAVYGAATALFGLSTFFALSYLLWSATGAADTVSSIIRGAIRQALTPDELRGRMVGVNMIFFMGGPQLGEVRAGLAAAAFGVPFAIISGGLAVVAVTAWAAWRYPRLRGYVGDW